MVPPSARFPTRRAALAEEAARRALAGLGPELVLPQLRAQTVQELLAQPGGAGCELCGTLQTLTGALTQCVRRRPGWLYVMFPSGITCPVPARQHWCRPPSWKPCALFWPAAGRRCWK